MKINKYHFASITINDREYKKDLIVFPHKIKQNWRREKGHSLLIKDLEEAITYKPDILIIGIGTRAMMKVSEDIKKDIKKLGIELTITKTGLAVDLFNEYLEDNKKVVGAFHLTC